MSELVNLTEKLDALYIVLSTGNGNDLKNRELYNEIFNEVIKLKNEQNLFHEYSPLSVFVERMEEYKKSQKDEDPYYLEVNVYKKAIKNILFINKHITYGYCTSKNKIYGLKYLLPKSNKRFNEIRNDRLNYVISELYKRGVEVNLYNYQKHKSTNITYKVNHEQKLKFEEQIKSLELSDNIIPNEEKFLDLSDSKATEKIIMLEKLGIIKFLLEKEPFNTSTNSLASAISGITGVKNTTVQSALNPMISKDAKQKNNPLNSAKTVSKVEVKLAGLGYIPSK